MLEVDGTCGYVLDSGDPATWGGEDGDECCVDGANLNEDGKWTCPHDVEDGEDLCIFHLPPEAKDDEAVVDAFLASLKAAADSDNSETRKRQFIGAQFGTFELNQKPSEFVTGDEDVRFTHSDVDSDFDWSGLTVDFEHLDFRGVTFRGMTDFTEAQLDSVVSFGDARFEGVALFQRTTVRDAVFSRAVFEGKPIFKRATFRSTTLFNNAEFQRSPEFGMAEFGGETNFRRVAFTDGAVFSGAAFGGESDFHRAVFGGFTSFQKADFGDESRFSKTEFSDTADFSSTDFDEQADFTGAGLERASFENSDVTDAIYTRADIREVNFESALLSRATFFEADLRGSRLSGAVLGDVRIDDDAKFLGHPSDDSDTSPHTLSTIRSKPCCVYDSEYEDENEYEDVDKAKSVYRALEELGGKAARPRLQARCFVRRQDLQKEDYWNDATEPDASLEERVIAGARWSRAKTSELVLLYGESPWRIIAYSLAIVLGFALLYPLGGWIKPEGGEPITYGRIGIDLVEFANPVYYSTLTFTALGFGEFKPVGFGRVLTTVETGLGAVLLALLVFILGRRAAR